MASFLSSYSFMIAGRVAEALVTEARSYTVVRYITVLPIIQLAKFFFVDDNPVFGDGWHPKCPLTNSPGCDVLDLFKEAGRKANFFGRSN